MRNTLTDLFIKHTEEKGLSKETFFTKENNGYLPFSNKQLIQQTFAVIKYFEKLELKAGDKIAIISENRVEWVAVDFACMFSKLISIPVYTSLSNSQIKFILQNSESKVCFVSNSLLLEKVLSIKSGLEDLKEIVVFNKLDLKSEPGKYGDHHIENYDIIVNNEIKISEEEIISRLKKLSENVSGSDLLTIIYTSGTTGIPKGVMLTHNNLYYNIKACQKVLPINETDVFLSYLPYSHAYERTAGYYLALFSGAAIYYAQNIDTIAKQLTEISPTMVITVPRLLDKMYNKLMKTGNEMKSGFQKKIFLWALEIAHSKKVTKENLKWKIADFIVYKKIRAKTGGRIRFFVTGGGAMNNKMGDFFEKIGITVLEGYGMTEASPVISVNPPGKNKYGTVGKPLNGVQIKLTKENEILIKGELVMAGYYKDDKNTKEIIADGWLHTGDIGEIDHEGYLKITDRKKSLIKTSGGKYVAPTQIEEMIERLPYIENALVLGNERMYVTALIVPEKSELISFARKNSIDFDSFTELINNYTLQKLIKRDIDNLQKDLANYERLRKFILLENSFSIEGGEFTPTMKVKRKYVEDKFKNEIEKMYLKI
ncbi:MAG: long-chain fatty acid--CoA ligase [Bacteroidota bacterium]|nr:long-chain fatty acid--CoA ligase [Bacteroidota bacterium]